MFALLCCIYKSLPIIWINSLYDFLLVFPLLYFYYVPWFSWKSHLLVILVLNMNIIYSFIDSFFSLADKIKTFCKPLVSASNLKATSRNYFCNKSIKMHLVVIRTKEYLDTIRFLNSQICSSPFNWKWNSKMLVVKFLD